MAHKIVTFLLLTVSFCIVVNTDEQKRKIESPMLRSLVKRWNDEVFGSGCNCVFHLNCKSDDYCQEEYGHGYSCVTSCCGLHCIHDSHHHHGYKDR